MTSDSSEMVVPTCRIDADLPEGWAQALLGNIVSMRLGKMLDAGKTRRGRYLPYLRNVNVRWGTIDVSDLLTMDFDNNEEDEFRLLPGDVLVCEGGEPGRAAIWQHDRDDIKFQKALHRVRLPSGVDPRWLIYHLRHDALQGSLEEYFTGSTIKHFTGVSLTRYVLRLAPVTEQRRIVASVESLLARANVVREQLAKVTAILKRFRQSVLAAACSGRLTEDWRETNDCVKACDDPSLRNVSSLEWQRRGDLPLKWQWQRLGDLAQCRLGKMLDNAKNSGSPVKYLRNTNVRWFAFDLADLLQMRVEPKEREVFSIIDGDVLVCEGGEPGRAAVWRGGKNELVFQKAIHRVRLPHFIVPGWFVFNLRHDTDFQMLDDLFTGSTIKHLTGVQFARYPVVVPPTEEQHEIVRRVEALFKLADAIEAHVAAATARAEKLTQAILAKAFRGELVPTEAELARREGRDYEPAGVLLERIRAEREAGKTGGKGEKGKRPR